MTSESWKDNDDHLTRFKELLFSAFGLKWPERFAEIEQQFGGPVECLFNFNMFISRCKKGPAKIWCPPDDHYYPRFQALLQTGVINKIDERTTTIEVELECLKKDRLLEICAELDLKVGKTQKKHKIIALLKDHPEIDKYVKPATLTDLYDFNPLPGQLTAQDKYDGPDAFEISSFSLRGSYTVNIKEWSCTCPDWQKNRDQAAPGSPGRLCKHLLSVMADHPVLIPDSMWPFGLIMADRYQHGKGMPGNGAVYVHKNGTAFIIESGDDGWINFYQANKRYGYHPEEKRWANKDKPDDSQAWLTKARSEGFYQTGSSDKKNSAKAKAAGGANAVIGCLGLIILIFFGVVLILFLVGK